jgi:hypothetical protein
MKIKIQFALIICLLIGCKRNGGDDCPPLVVEQRYIPENEKTIIKHGPNDTIKFVNTTTLDTLVFIGEGYHQDWSRKFVGISDYVPCPRDYQLERFSYYFKEKTTGEMLYLDVVFDDFKEIPSTRNFNIEYKKINYTNMASSIQYARDTTFLQGKILSKVVKMYTGYKTSNPASGWIAVYSTEHGGILRIELPGYIFLERIL